MAEDNNVANVAVAQERSSQFPQLTGQLLGTLPSEGKNLLGWSTRAWIRFVFLISSAFHWPSFGSSACQRCTGALRGSIVGRRTSCPLVSCYF